jgi:hypothetical protein
MMKILFFCSMVFFLKSAVVFSMDDEENPQIEEWNARYQRALDFVDTVYESIEKELKEKKQQEIKNQIQTLNAKLADLNISDDDKQMIELRIYHLQEKQKPFKLDTTKMFKKKQHIKDRKMTEDLSNNQSTEQQQQPDRKLTN